VKIAMLIAVATLSLGICPAVEAQGSGGPLPAPGSTLYIPALFSGDFAAIETQQATMQPDTSPLSGALKWTLGSGENMPNVILPSFQFSEKGDTNARNSLGTSGEPQAITTLSGGLTLQRSSTVHQLSLGYTGGGTFYSVSGNLNSTFQSLSLTEIYTFRRWTLTLSNFLSYANQIGLGTAWLPFYGFLNTPTGLQLTYIPEQTILTEPTPRIINTTVGQVEYRFGPRVSVTAGGSYGLLHFLDGDFFNNNQFGASAGVNYTPNGKDSFALTYSYSKFQYDNFPSSLNTHSIQMHYGRRLTGRYAMQFGAGPQIVNESSVQSHLGWNATASLTAKMGRTDANLGYYHTVTAGSGVLLGANTNAVQSGLARALWRVWNASTQLAYARNTPLSGSTGTYSTGTYSYINAGASMSRRINSQASGSFSFNAQHQAYGESGCSANGCAVMRYSFGVGLQWNFHPIQLE